MERFTPDEEYDGGQPGVAQDLVQTALVNGTGETEILWTEVVEPPTDYGVTEILFFNQKVSGPGTVRLNDGFLEGKMNPDLTDVTPIHDDGSHFVLDRFETISFETISTVHDLYGNPDDSTFKISQSGEGEVRLFAFRPGTLGPTAQPDNDDWTLVPQDTDLTADFLETTAPYRGWVRPPSPHQNHFRVWMEGIEPGEVTLTFTRHRNGNDYVSEHTLYVVPTVRLVADFNRDGVIDEVDIAAFDNGDTFYFWINDDNDKRSSEVDRGDIPGQTGRNADYYIKYRGAQAMHSLRPLDSGEVAGTRDLIDFMPVWLDVDDLLDGLDPDKVTIRLSGAPVNFVDPARELGQGLQGSESGMVHSDPDTSRKLGQGTTFDAHRWNFSKEFNAEAAAGRGVFLIEGRAPSTQPLKVEIRYEDRLLATTELKLRLSGVEDMYRHLNLMEVAGGSGGLPTSMGDPGAAYPDSELNDAYFVFVHGYNVNPQQARGWHAQMFKKLFWTGSRARFIGVTWHGASTQQFRSFTMNYHINVQNALATAPALKTGLDAFSGSPLTVAAHSLGNMVVSSAIHDHGFSPNHYFKLNSAVPAEAYDGAHQRNYHMDHQDWNGGLFVGNAAAHNSRAYPEHLWAREWHVLFKDLAGQPDDFRQYLTWRNRMEHTATGVNVYNYYSSGDPVFQPHEGPVTRLSILNVARPGDLGLHAYALQEKLKGRTTTNITGSPVGGWGFNLDDYWKLGFGLTSTGLKWPILGPWGAKKRPWPPAEAAEISEANLRTTPFFDKGPSGFADLYETGPAGSEFAENNEAEILARMIPASTNAAGREAVEVFGETFNTNMQDLQNHGWPAERTRDDPENPWLHSDINDVAYPYVRSIFEAIVDIGGL